MIKILAVSDNPELTGFFQEETIRQTCDKNVFFVYGFSKVNKKPGPMKELGAKP